MLGRARDGALELTEVNRFPMARSDTDEDRRRRESVDRRSTDGSRFVEFSCRRGRNADLPASVERTPRGRSSHQLGGEEHLLMLVSGVRCLVEE